MPDPEIALDRLPDWREELARQERNVIWLSRHSGIHQRVLYRLVNGERRPTRGHLIAIYRALGMAGPDGADL